MPASLLRRCGRLATLVIASLALGACDFDPAGADLVLPPDEPGAPSSPATDEARPLPSSHQLLAEGQGDATDVLGVDGALVVVSHGGGAEAQVRRIDLDGTVTPIATATRPSRVAVARGWVYWAEAAPDRVWRAPLGGGEREVVAKQAAGIVEVAAGGKWVVWARREGTLVIADAERGAVLEEVALAAPVRDLGVFGTSVIVALTSGEIIERDLVGGHERRIVPHAQPLSRVIADEDHIYWIDREAGAIFRAGRDTGLVEVVAATDDAFALALDAGVLYWTSPEAGTVWRVPASGGTPKLVAWGQPRPTHVVAAGGAVAWLNRGNATVVMEPAP